ncbi:Protein mpe1 [Oleoguttula sp. CCFEE 5521]
MSSSIFFKFKSQKEPSQITFDGTSLSVFEVKREIIAYSRLGDGTDFDLEIYMSDTNERYDDDTVQIPRSTTVVARRLPASKPGAGRAARYVSGKAPVNAKNQHRKEEMRPDLAKSTPVLSSTVQSGKPMTEEEKLQALFSENKASWAVDQAEIAAKGVNNRPFFPKKIDVPDKPPPPGYICHRCGDKGHWIQVCPTNQDTNYDGRPKFRRTTGIPRSFLKVIEKPEVVGEDGKVDVSQLPAGAMYTANGEWVIAKPDEASWDKFQQKHKLAADQSKELEADQEIMRARGVECSIDNKLFNDPVKTPCCATTYCRTCIEDALIDSDFTCPKCGEQCLLEDLAQDDEMVMKVKEFSEEMKAEKLKKQAEEASKTSNAGTPTAAKSPSPTGSRPTSANGKKRPAEEELANDRKPTGPAAMTKNTVANGNNTATPAVPAPKNMQEFVQQMNAMASGTMPGMQPGMPALMNPMMMNNPMMMQNPMMMMGGMPMMPGMGVGMPGMGMGPMNGGGMGFPMQQQGPGQFAGAPPAGPKAWQQQQGWSNGQGGGGFGRGAGNAGRGRKFKQRGQ